VTVTARDTERLMSQAIALHRVGRASDAIALYGDVLRRDPTPLRRTAQATGELVVSQRGFD
jgi:hypothetical protein